MERSCDQKSLTGQPGPMSAHNADAGWQKPQTNLRNVWSGTARSIWVKNIMSPSKLREKWDELVIRLGRSPVQRCVNHISEPDTEIPPGFRG